MKKPKTFQEAARIIAEECLDLMFIKQNDYGPRNIIDLGEKGVFVRSYDKIQRLKRLVWMGIVGKVTDEKIEDTWRDLGNYSVIAIMLRRGWFDLPFREEENEET